MDPAAEERVCVAGEWPDDLTEGSELGSASVSCCEAVAERKAKYKMRTWTLDLIVFVCRIFLFFNLYFIQRVSMRAMLSFACMP